MSDKPFVFNENLDREFLRSIYEDDHEHAEMVFSKFISSIDEQMDEIESGFNSGDADNFRKKIHKLKPVLSFVGLTNLTTSAETIERRCNEVTGTTALNELYTAFKSQLKQMIPVVQNDLMKLKALTA